MKDVAELVGRDGGGGVVERLRWWLYSGLRDHGW